jgi:hypothetical protein
LGRQDIGDQPVKVSAVAMTNLGLLKTPPSGLSIN